jgi:hypothetical protein
VILNYYNTECNQAQEVTNNKAVAGQQINAVCQNKRKTFQFKLFCNEDKICA